MPHDGFGHTMTAKVKVSSRWLIGSNSSCFPCTIAKSYAPFRSSPPEEARKSACPLANAMLS